MKNQICNTFATQCQNANAMNATNLLLANSCANVSSNVFKRYLLTNA